MNKTNPPFLFWVWKQLQICIISLSHTIIHTGRQEVDFRIVSENTLTGMCVCVYVRVQCVYAVCVCVQYVCAVCDMCLCVCSVCVQ